MARELRFYDRPTTLERPVLIGAFRGWNDGGQAPRSPAATSRASGAERIRGHRPGALRTTSRRRGRWSRSRRAGRGRSTGPRTRSSARRIPGSERDAILLVGVEPNYRWRTFSELVTEVARDLGVELAVTLGALVADVPHTRPSPVTGGATDPQLVDELGPRSSRATRGRPGSSAFSSTRAAAPGFRR